MSNKALAWVRDLRLPERHLLEGRGCSWSSAKHVLTLLADHLNEKDRRCFPSIRTLAEESGLSRNTVIRALQVLEELALITRITRHGGARSGNSGGSRSNSYTLHTDRKSPRVTFADSPIGAADERKSRDDTVAGVESFITASESPSTNNESPAATPETNLIRNKQGGEISPTNDEVDQKIVRLHEVSNDLETIVNVLKRYKVTADRARRVIERHNNKCNPSKHSACPTWATDNPSTATTVKSQEIQMIEEFHVLAQLVRQASSPELTKKGIYALEAIQEAFKDSGRRAEGAHGLLTLISCAGVPGEVNLNHHTEIDEADISNAADGLTVLLREAVSGTYGMAMDLEAVLASIRGTSNDCQSNRRFKPTSGRQ